MSRQKIQESTHRPVENRIRRLTGLIDVLSQILVTERLKTTDIESKEYSLELDKEIEGE